MRKGKSIEAYDDLILISHESFRACIIDYFLIRHKTMNLSQRFNEVNFLTGLQCGLRNVTE